MGDPNSEASVSHLEARALLLEQEHQRRRLLALAVTAPAAACVCVAAMAQRPVVTALAVVLAAVAAGVWAWHLGCDRGKAGKVRRAWRAWLAAMSWQESAEALLVVFREYHPASGPDASKDLGVKSLAWLRMSALDAQLADDGVLFHTMYSLMLADMSVRVRQAQAADILQEARAEAQNIVSAAEAERAEILRRAEVTAREFLSGERRPEEPTAPAAPAWMAFDPQVAELRRLFDVATREASKGAVHESAAAAVILAHPGRWSAYAPPQPASEALLALFDPLCASLPPPPSPPTEPL
jgi:hypothetical protein